MAKQNKINKKREKRRARKSVERQDYRQGGRVALQRGGSKRREPVEMGRQPIEMQPIKEAPIITAQPTTQPDQQPAQQQPSDGATYYKGDASTPNFQLQNNAQSGNLQELYGGGIKGLSGY